MKAELEHVGNGSLIFLHLAALTSVRACEDAPNDAFALNVQGSVKWLYACAAVGCQRFVHVSTSHVFRPTAGPEWLTTARPGDAISVYGRSKLEAEIQLLKFGQSLNIEVIIVRPFSLFAEDMTGDFLYPALLRRARERDFTPLLGYKNVRDFVEIGEAAQEIWRIATWDRLRVRIFHICTGRPRSIRDFATSVMERLDVSRSDLAAMFPETTEPPDFLISKPTPL